MDFNIVLGCLWYMLPAYFANMAPILVRKYFKFLARPVDFGKTWLGKPILGAHKTFRGLIFGTLVGVVVMLFQVSLFNHTLFFRDISLFVYPKANYLLLGFLLGSGALVGDMAESFFKRRFSIKPGKRWIPFDQLDYVVGALVFGSFVYTPSLAAIIVILVASFLLHIIANHIGYYLGIKKTKW